MKNTILCLAISLLSLTLAAQNTGIGTASPHPSAVLDITGNKGILLPRMTTAVRNQIAAPAKGLLVYDSTRGTFVFNNGGTWLDLLHPFNNVWLPDGATNIYANAANVGIGTTSPTHSLHVVNNNANDGGWAQGIVVENTNDGDAAGEAAISFRNKSFSEGKQWSIGINQTSSPLAFNFGSTFAGGNTRMVIDTIGRVGLGTIAPEPSAQMHMNSTARGLLLPRMNSAQRKAITDPALGLFVYDTDKRSLFMFDGNDWVTFAPQAPDFVPVTLRTVDTIPQLLDIGTEVAIDGELAVTKSTQYEISGLADVGCVFVYKKNGGSWDYVQQIIPNTIKQGAYFGSSLALSGNLLVVGSPYWDANLVDKGKIWYYQWDGTSFQFLDSLIITPGTTGAFFGYSVALKGNTLVVGASQEDINGNEAGGIYVYTFNPATSRFGNRVRLSAPNGKPGDKFGYSVDLDGAYIVAGAPFHPFGTELNKGVAHVWTGSGSSWGYQDSCTFAPSATAYDRLGLRLSISGNNIICGANFGLSANNNPGSAIYFKRNGSQWDKTQEIRSPDADNLGTVPMVVTRGNWLLVGNSAEDHLIGPRGNVWVYALENGLWVKKKRIYNYTTLDPGQRWPDALGFDGNSIMIGSYTYNDRQGAVFFTTVTD